MPPEIRIQFDRSPTQRAAADRMAEIIRAKDRPHHRSATPHRDSLRRYLDGFKTQATAAAPTTASPTPAR